MFAYNKKSVLPKAQTINRIKKVDKPRAIWRIYGMVTIGITDQTKVDGTTLPRVCHNSLVIQLYTT